MVVFQKDTGSANRPEIYAKTFDTIVFSKHQKIHKFELSYFLKHHQKINK